MKPIFCRIGSKYKIATKIIKQIPSHKTYVEPFFGGGGVFFKKQPSEKEIINDLDKQLIKDYKLIKMVSTDLKQYPLNLKSIPSQTTFIKKPNKTKEEQLTESIIRRCGGFGSQYITTGKVYKPANPYSKLKNIQEYKKRFNNTTIISQDYRSVIHKYDSPTTFFYLDPPYEKTKDLYDEENMNFEEMYNLLKTIKGKFLLSINDSPTIRQIFKGFKINSLTVKAYGNVGIGKNDRKELFIKNY
jgi:DNA adenine methylase